MLEITLFAIVFALLLVKLNKIFDSMNDPRDHDKD